MSGLSVRTAGVVAIVTGLVGAAAGVFLALVPPSVPSDRFSAPLDAGSFVAVQLLFALHHLGLVVAVLGVRTAGAIRTRTGRHALSAGAASLLALAAVEVLACLGADSLQGSPTVDALNTAYGVVTLLIGVSLTVAGVALVRSGAWPGWRGWTLLATGVYLFVPLTPLMAVGGGVAHLGIAGWMLTFVVLGVALRTAPDRAPHPNPPSTVRRPGHGADVAGRRGR